MLRIFNTLNNKKEKFTPIKSNIVNMYVCGITPYDFCHLGHGRTFIFFDIVVRFLRKSGYQVNYIRNITNIDDKIIQKSKEYNLPVDIITNNFIKEMRKDFSLLNMLIPTQEPLVTDHMESIFKMIQSLLATNYAYHSKNGDIFFSVNKDSNYGKLSNQVLKKLKKTKISINKNSKKHVEDFVLWKKSKQNEPYWISPWGKGRPGWHIECSAINDFYFGNTIDIHGGGIDLLFPHHENENAQSTCYNQSSMYSKYWMHSGMVFLKQQKMSKSGKNCVYLRDILKKNNPESIRLFFLSTHYKKPIYYDKNSSLRVSFFSLSKLYVALQQQNIFCFTNDKFKQIKIYGLSYKKKFFHAMNDDFNTPKALSILFELSKKIQMYKKKKSYCYSNYLSYILKKLGNVLGILFQNTSDFFSTNSVIKNEKYKRFIKTLIKKRNYFRILKKWKKADFIKEKLLKLNIRVEDSEKKTTWKYINTFNNDSI
ncbi:cysteine--tRNA ligase [Buchnera aphidicola]|uniref:Cysteine--tRNA ligase n=1 Tax=Buchnera aphidicola (Anoecia oenotherae) TaxID=1241833 RepID=A0A4D6XR58_9GAMM|nr:cysteine--tRNA ligase [Buchnera aphidicola]QCI19493.1 cysteine--tRNA ligase [Buchnera aphidicola (Anoecia oenotherae)]